VTDQTPENDPAVDISEEMTAVDDAPTPATAEPAAETAPEPAPVPAPAAPTPASIRVPSPAVLAGRLHGSAAAKPSEHGRVDESGTVFVRTADGWREVGSYPGASHTEALGYFTRKYDELLASADLLLQRVTHTDLPVREGSEGLAKLREQVTDARVVGDLAALDASGVHGRAVEADGVTIRAGIAALEGRPTEAIALYRDALRSWRDLGLAWDEALAGVDMALLLDPTDPWVRANAEAAREILVRLEAAPFIARLDAALARPADPRARAAAPSAASVSTS